MIKGIGFFTGPLLNEIKIFTRINFYIKPIQTYSYLLHPPVKHSKFGSKCLDIKFAYVNLYPRITKDFVHSNLNSKKRK